MTTISYPQKTFFKVGSNVSYIRPKGELVLKADDELERIINPRLATPHPCYQSPTNPSRSQTTIYPAQPSTPFWNKAVTRLGKLRALQGSLQAEGGLSKLTVKDFILILNRHINTHNSDPEFSAFLIDCGLAVTEFDSSEKIRQKAQELAPNAPQETPQQQKQRVFAEVIRILTIPAPKPTVPILKSLVTPSLHPR